jgi:NADH dehydrogenase
MSGYNICMIGGSGFVGSQMTTMLSRLRHRVTLLTRHPQHARHLSVLPGIKIIQCDVHDPRQLDTQLANHDVVINLVGILNEPGKSGEGFRRAHFELPRKILGACHHNNVPRLLHMSALNADANSGPSHYLRSKGDGENHVHTFAGKIAVTSFRPSVIFGPHDSFFNRFASLIKISPWIFPLACGSARFAPVYVNDVCDAFIRALDDKTTHGKRYDLCGPEDYSLHELVAYTAQLLGHKTRVMDLPNWISRMQARILQHAPGKPFTLDNYNSMRIDSVCGNHCPRQTTAIHSIVPWYIGSYPYHLQQQHWRQTARR